MLRISSFTGRDLTRLTSRIGEKRGIVLPPGLESDAGTVCSSWREAFCGNPVEILSDQPGELSFKLF